MRPAETWTGFCVKAVYLDSISPEEKADFFWLQEHAPELELIATIQVKMRVLPRGASGEVLAIGQKAAYFGRITERIRSLPQKLPGRVCNSLSFFSDFDSWFTSS